MIKAKLCLGIILLSFLVIVFGACTGEDAGEFEDMKWILESFGEPGNQQAVLEGTQVTVTFESAENQLSGSAGCNSYFGDYEVNGSKLSIHQLANTEMACLEPEGVMTQETRYLQALHAVDSYELLDGKLRLNSEGQVLVFRAE